MQIMNEFQKIKNEKNRDMKPMKHLNSKSNSKSRISFAIMRKEWIKC